MGSPVIRLIASSAQNIYGDLRTVSKIILFSRSGFGIHAIRPRGKLNLAVFIARFAVNYLLIVVGKSTTLQISTIRHVSGIASVECFTLSLLLPNPDYGRVFEISAGHSMDHGGHPQISNK
jgi:hypothetical protein